MTTRRLEQIDQVRAAADQADAKAAKFQAWGDQALATRYGRIAAELKWLAVELSNRADRSRRAVEALQRARFAATVEDAEFEEAA